MKGDVVGFFKGTLVGVAFKRNQRGHNFWIVGGSYMQGITRSVSSDLSKAEATENPGKLGEDECGVSGSRGRFA